ncbi:MAG: hypothetical protein ACI9D0_001275, partial [Bacteroidia bacterium]
CGTDASRERLAVLVDLESTVAAKVPFSNRMHGGEKT